MKRILRYMPRRATVHRHRFLRPFADFTRSRSYLWAFRPSTVVPALYAGWILGLMPVMGIQIPLAVALAVFLRANLPILVVIQMISNPFTVAFIYFATFKVGSFFMWWIDYPMLSLADDEASFTQSLRAAPWSRLRYAFSSMFLGGTILGYAAGFISSLIYQIGVYRAAQTYLLLRQRHEERVKAAKAKEAKEAGKDEQAERRSAGERA